jgi:choline-glycine betaine transporter
VIKHGVAASILFYKVRCVLLDDLFLDYIHQRDLRLNLKIVDSTLLLLQQMLLCNSKIFRAVEVHGPPLCLTVVIFLGLFSINSQSAYPLVQVLNKVSIVVLLVVFVTLPDEVIILLGNVSLDKLTPLSDQDQPSRCHDLS